MNPKIALIRNGKSSQKSSVSIFPSAHELITSSKLFDVVVIDQPKATAELTIKLLRITPAYQLRLIFCLQEMSAVTAALADGVAPENLSRITESFRHWSERMQTFNRGKEPESFEWRVKAWMWTRPDRLLEPCSDPKLAQHYFFPVLDTLGKGVKINSFDWLSMMKNKGVFDDKGLIDRVRVCRSCSSSRLNFVDVCPECSHMDIERKASLHCYTCGHVGHQESFMKGGKLVCPHCIKVLRHIGSDYDRPMENYSCNACSAFFVDAAVKATCRDCNHVHDTGDLCSISVKSYQLTEHGRLMCRHGDQYQPTKSSSFQDGKFISPLHFKDILDWQIQMSRRYQQFEFCLLGIKIIGLDDFGKKVGYLKASNFMDKVVERINGTLRETDRGCRSAEDIMWLLLPSTSALGLESFQARLSEISSQFRGKDYEEMGMVFLSFATDMNQDLHEDADLLVARLTNDFGGLDD